MYAERGLLKRELWLNEAIRVEGPNQIGQVSLEKETPGHPEIPPSASEKACQALHLGFQPPDCEKIMSALDPLGLCTPLWQP